MLSRQLNTYGNFWTASNNVTENVCGVKVYRVQNPNLFGFTQ